MGRKLTLCRQRRVRGGEHERVVAKVTGNEAVGDDLAGGTGIATGHHLGPAGGNLDRFTSELRALIGAERVVLPGSAVGNQAAHATGEAELDHLGKAIQIQVTIGTHRRDDRRVDALKFKRKFGHQHSVIKAVLLLTGNRRHHRFQRLGRAHQSGTFEGNNDLGVVTVGKLAQGFELQNGYE